VSDELKKRILIVEDEVLSAADMSEMIKSAGYDPLGPVSSGKDAIEWAIRENPDLILMDIHLRDAIDGISAASEIRSRIQTPVVFITAHSDVETLERVKKTEPYGFITKPFDEKDLYLSVELAFGKIEAESKFVKKERWYSTILGSIGDGVIATNSDGEIVYMNNAAEIMTGFTISEAIGKEIRDVFRITNSPDDAENSGVNVSFEFNTIEVSSFIKNNILVSKNGMQRSVDYSVFSLDSSQQKKSGGVLVFRDITERLDAQNAIRESFSKLNRAMSGIIEAMALAVESRDPYTAGHQRRVADLAMAIAGVMGLDAGKTDGIRMAGMIHDLGKISIPAEILSKPGKLSDVEFGLIKAHPKAGYDILKKIDFPWPVAEIVIQHHERMDGTGYPQGLRGEDILIEARVIAVADIVEAMASHRPYRPSLGLDAAIEEILSKKGIYLDPDVVDACVCAIKEKGFVI
jgi:PAS domain S-box-containing protein/putative nucleotidyltransferase with HDIG domain